MSDAETQEFDRAAANAIYLQGFLGAALHLPADASAKQVERAVMLVIAENNSLKKTHTDRVDAQAADSRAAIINRYRVALQKIADEDYRGNRPNSAVIAFNALQEDAAATSPADVDVTP